MMTIVTCSNCGKKEGLNYKFVVTEYEKPCKECGERKEHEKEFIFCSLRCSRQYIERLEKHKCEDHWKCSGLQLKKDLKQIESVWVSCQICYKMEFIPYKKGMKVEGLKEYLQWRKH